VVDGLGQPGVGHVLVDVLDRQFVQPDLAYPVDDVDLDQVAVIPQGLGTDLPRLVRRFGAATFHHSFIWSATVMVPAPTTPRSRSFFNSVSFLAGGCPAGTHHALFIAPPDRQRRHSMVPLPVDAALPIPPALVPLGTALQRVVSHVVSLVSQLPCVDSGVG
jgi:hypothetical protein